MKYKVGDKVKIKSRKEIENLTDITDSMLKKCGAVMTIKSCLFSCNSYLLSEDTQNFLWSDEMIEGLVEEETKPNIIEEAKTYWDSIKDAWICPEGYIFKDENGNVINATKIVLEKKKKEYPKTFLGCCDVLGIEDLINRGVNGYRSELLDAFQKLLICRDAYWKIAGEEMGLGKPWKPDWKNSEESRYCIVNIEGDINLPEKILTKWILKVTNKILVFPTEEMRDTFYENFKSEIEMCKELL